MTLDQAAVGIAYLCAELAALRYRVKVAAMRERRRTRGKRGKLFASPPPDQETETALADSMTRIETETAALRTLIGKITEDRFAAPQIGSAKPVDAPVACTCDAQEGAPHALVCARVLGEPAPVDGAVSDLPSEPRLPGMTPTGNTDSSAVDAATDTQDHTARVCAALDHTARLGAYAEILMESRTFGHPNACGSVVVVEGQHGRGSEDDVRATERAFRACKWEPWQHTAVAEGCTVFRAPLRPEFMLGLIAVVSIESIPDDTLLSLEDPKGTSFVEAVLEVEDLFDKGQRADDVWVILGPAGTGEGVWTWHPGPPVTPSTLFVSGLMDKPITAANAKTMGITHVKLREKKRDEFKLAV
jgi:hypothetical protein